MKNILTLLTLIITITTLNADTKEFSHDCSRPLKSGKLTEQREVNSYNSNMKAYRECMFSFIDKHKVEAKKHRDAINNTINEWNNFANNSKKKDEGRKYTGSNSVSQGGHHTVGHSDPYKISTGFKF